MKRSILIGAIAIASLPALATETGPLMTGSEAGDWGVGVHYYYGRSQWDTSHDLVDDMIGDLTQKGAYITADYTILPWLEAHAAIGGMGYNTTPESSTDKVESSMDTFFSVGATAKIVETDEVMFGPFLRYSKYSDYELSGAIVNDAPSTTYDVETSQWQKLVTGLMVQHTTEPANIYYGLYHLSHSFDVSGSYGANDVDFTAKEDRDLGLFIGAVWPVNDKFTVSMEYDHTTDAAVSFGVNYRFHPAKIITKTEVIYREPAKPKGPAVAEQTILFREGSAEVEKGYWGALREFAAFLNKYEDTEAYIGGHCDCVGSEETNKELSQRRGDAVKEMLVELYNIDPSSLHVLAMGEAFPAVEQDEVHGRKENRRVILVGRAYGEY